MPGSRSRRRRGGATGGLGYRPPSTWAMKIFTIMATG